MESGDTSVHCETLQYIVRNLIIAADRENSGKYLCTNPLNPSGNYV